MDVNIEVLRFAPSGQMPETVRSYLTLLNWAAQREIPITYQSTSPKGHVTSVTLNERGLSYSIYFDHNIGLLDPLHSASEIASNLNEVAREAKTGYRVTVEQVGYWHYKLTARRIGSEIDLALVVPSSHPETSHATFIVLL